MRKRNRLHLPALLTAWLVLVHVQTAFAWPFAAGGCDGGRAAVGEAHLQSQMGRPVVNGTLDDGGYVISLNDVIQQPGSLQTIQVGVEYALSVQVSTAIGFRGVLVRLEAESGVSTVNALTPVMFTQPAYVCVTPVVGICHTDNTLKTEADGTLLLNQETKFTLDVTIVLQSRASGSYYYYNSFDLEAVYLPYRDVPIFPVPTSAPSTESAIATKPTHSSPPTLTPITSPSLPPSSRPNLRVAASPTPSPISSPSAAPSFSPRLQPPSLEPSKESSTLLRPTSAVLSTITTFLPTTFTATSTLSPSTGPTQSSSTLAPTSGQICPANIDVINTCYRDSLSSSAASSCNNCIQTSIPALGTNCTDLNALVCTALSQCQCGACTADIQSYFDCALTQLIGCLVMC